MKILAASSLFHAINTITYNSKRDILPHITAIPGLNLNPYAYDQRKNLQYLISNSKWLGRRRDLVIWHDTINNTLTKHKSNRKPLTPERLCSYLKGNSFRFKAIIYCQREGAPDILQDLLKTGILIIQVTKHIVSRRNQRHEWVLKQYRALHQESSQELHTLYVVWKHSDNLRRLLNKGRGQPKVGKKQRKARQKRQAKEANRLLTDQVVRSSGDLPEQDAVVCSDTTGRVDANCPSET